MKCRISSKALVHRAGIGWVCPVCVVTVWTFFVWSCRLPVLVMSLLYYQPFCVSTCKTCRVILLWFQNFEAPDSTVWTGPLGERERERAGQGTTWQLWSPRQDWGPCTLQQGEKKAWYISAFQHNTMTKSVSMAWVICSALIWDCTAKMISFNSPQVMHCVQEKADPEKPRQNSISRSSPGHGEVWAASSEQSNTRLFFQPSSVDLPYR